MNEVKVFHVRKDLLGVIEKHVGIKDHLIKDLERYQ